MPFITQGKANLKYILIVVVLVAIVGGGILGYQYRQIIKEKVFINEKEEFSNSVEIWNKKDIFLNEQVTLEGRAVGIKSCTLMACPLFAPCCNTCRGELGLRISKDTIVTIYGNRTQEEGYGLYNGQEVWCHGDTCYIECYPLEEGEKYKVTGILKMGVVDFPMKQEGYYLEIKSFELF
jgi:hypothetical protein